MRKGKTMAKSETDPATGYIVIDTETTGLDPDKDEVLSLAIVGPGGEVLFNSLIKPQRRKRWPKAQEVNGISPADVADMPTLAACMDEIAPYFDGSRLVVGYNVKFDIDMLKAGGLRFRGKTFDVMRESEILTGQRLKLAECADFFRYGEFAAHGALEDALATEHCYRRLLESERYAKVKELQARGLSKSDAKVMAAQSSGGCLLQVVAALALPVIAAVVAAIA